MIQVKENLCEVNNFVIEPENRNYNQRKIKLPNNLVDGEIYTFSAKVNQSDNGSGRCGFVIGKQGFSNSVWTTIPIKNFVYKFKYEKKRQAEILIYSDVQEKTNNIGAEFYNISIVKGDQMTPYLPHKSKVKADNQAIFPIGGGITKSTLYRGCKGVSLC